MREDTLASQERSERFARKSKRELFLDQMEQLVPWGELLALLDAHDPPTGISQPPVGLSILLRTYFVQQWFNLSDPGAEEALYESSVLRSFVGVDLGVAPAPDETEIHHFRQQLEEQDLGGEILVRVNTYLAERGIRITTGTNPDATIHDAPSSTEYTVSERDSQLQQAGEGGLQDAGAKARTRAIVTDRIETPILGTSGLSIAVISPDEQRRKAALRALSECQTGQVQEFDSYPPDLDDAPGTLNRDFDVVLVDLDTNSKHALDLVETISVRGLATAIVYSAQADPDLLLSSMRAGAREFLTLPFNPGPMRSEEG